MSFPDPGLTVPTLSNWQASIGGLTIGLGTAYGWYDISGIIGLVPMRTGDVPRALEHGEMIGLDLMTGRDIGFNIDVMPDATSFAHALQALAAALAPGLNTEVPFWFQLPGFPLLASMVRPRKFELPIDVGWANNFALGPVELHATDSRLYGAPSVATTIGASTAVTNNGNIETRPVIVIAGPATNPTIENTSLASTPFVEFLMTVASGHTLTIDMDFQTAVLDQGTTSAASQLANLTSNSNWWNLPPGSSTISYSGGGTCTLKHADGYVY